MARAKSPAGRRKAGGTPSASRPSNGRDVQTKNGRSPQRSRVGNGSVVVTGVDSRGGWCRRLKTCLQDYTSDIPDASTAERSLMRRAAVLEVELETLERRFALAGEAKPDDLDLYQRTAGNLRRLLQTIGLERRSRDVTPSLREIEQHYREAAE
jgi:hypothetical protein